MLLDSKHQTYLQSCKQRVQLLYHMPVQYTIIFHCIVKACGPSQAKEHYWFNETDSCSLCLHSKYALCYCKCPCARHEDNQIIYLCIKWTEVRKLPLNNYQSVAKHTIRITLHWFYEVWLMTWIGYSALITSTYSSTLTDYAEDFQFILLWLICFRSLKNCSCFKLCNKCSIYDTASTVNTDSIWEFTLLFFEHSLI